MPEENPTPAPSMAEIKEKLESEKLLLEIAQLKRPWWQQAPYWAAATPAIVAVLALLVAWAGGFFDRRLAELERQRNVLGASVGELERQRNVLRASVGEVSAREVQAMFDKAIGSLLMGGESFNE